MFLRIRLISIAAAGLALSAFTSACGSSEAEENIEEEELKVVQRVGARGGSLRIDDPETGTSFELRIPAGALDDESELTVRRVPAAEWPPEAEGNPPIGGALFELLPEGTTFSVPATAVTRFDQTPGALGDSKSRTLPSHVSRTSGGTVHRHPTVISGRGGSATMVTRTSHFSMHWASTQTDDGEFGVNLVWPEGPFGPESWIDPVEFSVWTSSESTPSRTIVMATFVPYVEPLVLAPGFFELGEEALDSPIEAELLDYFEANGDEVELYSGSQFLALEIQYPVGEPHEFEPGWDAPSFSCNGTGVGTGWVVVQTFIPGGEEGDVPLTYIEEVSFDCGE